MTQRCKRQDWIISISSPEEDRVRMRLCKNVIISDVKKILTQLVKQERNNNDDRFVAGSTTMAGVCEIRENSNGFIGLFVNRSHNTSIFCLIASARFEHSEYHNRNQYYEINYTAMPLTKIKEISLEE